MECVGPSEDSVQQTIFAPNPFVDGIYMECTTLKHQLRKLLVFRTVYSKLSIRTHALSNRSTGIISIIHLEAMYLKGIAIRADIKRKCILFSDKTSKGNASRKHCRFLRHYLFNIKTITVLTCLRIFLN